MNINKYCAQIGHEAPITHLCIFEDCQLLLRQCCILCINEGIHNHGKSDHEHIRLQQEILQVQQKLPQGENDKNINPNDFSKRKYIVKEIENHGSYSLQTTAHISNDEKYLAYVGKDQILKIYDLKQDKIIQEIKINDYFIRTCQFSFDSSQLYVGSDYQDYPVVLGFDVNKNFKKIVQYMLSDAIYQIVIIQNQYQIICFQNKIIKTDIKRKKQIFKLITQDTYGNLFKKFNVFDYNQQYDFIIGGSTHGSINLWDFSKRCRIINQEKAHSGRINQIQFINKIQNVLSLNQANILYKWKVDLISNNLIKLQEYQDPNMIYSFCSINQNQNLLLICGYYVKIVCDTGQTINEFDHKCEKIEWRNISIRQLDNARYILIATNSSKREKIMLASTLE